MKYSFLIMLFFIPSLMQATFSDSGRERQTNCRDKGTLYGIISVVNFGVSAASVGAIIHGCRTNTLCPSPQFAIALPVCFVLACYYLYKAQKQCKEHSPIMHV